MFREVCFYNTADKNSVVVLKTEDVFFDNELYDIVKIFFPNEYILNQKQTLSMDLHNPKLIINVSYIHECQTASYYQIYACGGNKSFYFKVCDAGCAECNDHFSNLKNKAFIKKEVKRRLYIILKKFTNTDMPWGSLTGIRPSKIVHSLLDEGYSIEYAQNYLKDFYFVSSKKAELISEVALNERIVLERSIENSAALYAGIPFCPTRCLYCSFTSNPVKAYENLVEQYLYALEYELSYISNLICNMGKKLESIYIGGGTPTSLTWRQLSRLMKHIAATFDFSDLLEYTVEAGRPDSIDKEKLKVIKEYGATRISINPQTMNIKSLQLIGRSHTPDDIKKAFETARQENFNNINADIIAGLPEEDVEMFANTLYELNTIKPESLTVHVMAVKRASILKENVDKYSLSHYKEVEKMVDMAYSYAKDMGMRPYYLYRQKNILGNLENVGYSMPGYESIYNVQIMDERQTIFAAGAGAISKFVFEKENRIERAANVKNVEEYIKRIDEMCKRKEFVMK